MKIIQESANFVVVSCRHIVTQPLGAVSDDNAQQRLVSVWLDFFEKLHAEGLRPIQRFSYPGPEAVVCVREPAPLLAYDTTLIDDDISTLEASKKGAHAA